MYYLYSMLCLLLAQTQPTRVGDAPAPAADAPATSGTSGAANADPSFFDSMILYLPLMLAMMLVYMLIIKPQPKGGQAGGATDFKKNDRVVTAGGIVGTVIKNDPDAETTTLRVDDSGNTKMQFMTSSIVKVLSDEKDKDAKEK